MATDPLLGNLSESSSLLSESLPERLDSGERQDSAERLDAAERLEGTRQRYKPSRTELKLLRQLKKTCEDYQLLAPGDHLMVAMSGGKDSYGLLHLLRQLVPKLPFEVKLTAVHLNQGQPGYEGAPLAEYLARSGARYEIVTEDTYSVVMEHVREGSTYCSLCSRLRRGVLYRVAERLGCNKIALGHHRDDCLETFLLNLFYSGKLQSMPARYQTDDGRFEVIRPLIQCEEESLRSLSAEQSFPILPCNLCGSQDGLKRERMTELLAQLEAEHPTVKSVMMAALSNVCPTHLLDPDVERAWAARPAEIQAKASLGAGRTHQGDRSAVLLDEGGCGAAEGPPEAEPAPGRRLPLLGV